MAIQIIRNADGNCIEFRGSTNPVYWNACLSGQVDPNYPDRINVINDVATAAGAETIYEFYQLPYTDFRDAEGDLFLTATDAANYITAQGNVIATEQGAYQGVWNADTNTPDVGATSPAAGDFYFVSVEGTTSLGGVASWKQNDRVMWSGTAWEKIPARQLTGASTSTTLLSTNTSVPADGEAPTGDPLHQLAGWYYSNSDQAKINWYLYGDTVDLSNSYGDFGGFYMTITFRNTTSLPYWTLYTARQNDGNDVSWYRSRVNYLDDTAFASVTVDTQYLVHSAGLDVTGIHPDLPRISLGEDSLTTVGPKGNAEELYLMALSTSSGRAAGSDEFIVEEAGYKLGDYFRTFRLSAVPVASAATGADEVTNLDFRLDPTSTTILTDDGKQYGVNSIHANANEDGSVSIVALPSEQVLYADLDFSHVTINEGPAYTSQNAAVNALNALFQVLPAGTGGDYTPVQPTLAGVAITPNVNNTIVPTTTMSDGVTTHAYGQLNGNDDDIIWSTETIDAAGEYYTVKIAGEGRFVIGLGREEDGDRTELEAGGNLATAAGLIWSQAFYDYGLYTAPWTTYGSSPGLSYGPGWTFSSTDVQMRYNVAGVQEELNGAGAPGNRDGALFKIGIADDGYITCWYFDAGRSNDWIKTARRNLTTEEGTYFLVVKLWNGNNVMVDLPLRSAVDPVAPLLNYRYIESPDGSFHYPLFASEEEANYVDSDNGGSGTSHAHVYPDDPTSTTWYMPDTGGYMAVSSAPADTSAITYTEIPTNADDAYAPSPLTLTDHTFAENVAVNLQIVPQDVVATVTGLPTYLTYNNGFITGTTTYVPRTLEYPVTVERSNGYGTTTQTFNITISDNASIGEFTGFTRTDGNLVAPNRIVLNNWDALLQYDTVLNEDQELTYSFSGQVPPTIGILSSEGESRVADFDPAVHTLGAGSHDFADSAKWDLRYVTFGGNLGSTGKYALIGWQDNTATSGAYPGDQDGGEWKLAYELDTVHGSNHHLVLYYNGVEKLRSQDHYAGPLTITLAAFDDQQQQDVYVPSNWAITTTGAGSTTPPSGFADPLLAGTMSSTTLLGDEAAVQLTATLELNHRYIVPQAWLEANVLPHIAGSGASASNDEQFYFGVAKSGANWSSIDENDFEACFRVEGTSTANLSRLFNGVGNSSSTVSVGSTTDAFYDYAIEWDGSQLHVIASSLSALTTQPGVNNGGTFSRVLSRSFTGGTNLTLAMATRNGAEIDLTTAGLQEVRIPFGTRELMVGEASNGNPRYSALQPSGTLFDETSGGHAPAGFGTTPPTLTAGQTYRFVYHASMEADDYVQLLLASDDSVYTTGVTTFGSGDPAFSSAYKGIEFTVPSDAPPLKVRFYNSYQSGYFTTPLDLPISGSTYTVDVTGITSEGPAANQTGNTGANLFDDGDHGWISIDEPLGAGERLILSQTFVEDLVSAMTDGSTVRIGLKDGSWTDANDVAGFEGGVYISIYRLDVNNVQYRLYGNGSATSVWSGTVAAANQFSFFLEITNSGNNVRAGANNYWWGNDVTSTTYADWGPANKIQSGDQGFGITTRDVMVLGSGTLEVNADDVDWTELSEISVPTPAATLTTSWTKALDFSGSSERTQQVDSGTYYAPLRMSGVNNNAAGNTTAGYTSNDTNARPWATAIVFQVDGNSSNQHIWNLGEGSGSTDDNIYLRLDASRNLYFGWGRTGELNEVQFGFNISTSQWYGVYIASTGERLGSGHAAGDIADCFDIRFVDLSTGSVGSNLSTYANWSALGSSFGARMNRQFTGYMTIGGRGANRNFHGKVAGMVATTLELNVPMPTDAEISMMVRDPEQWLTDYKVGNAFRAPNNYASSTNFAKNATVSSWSTQVWLMGDGTSDAYAQIRNQVYPGLQNYTPLNMISMVSNDIQTVTIPGLT